MPLLVSLLRPSSGNKLIGVQVLQTYLGAAPEATVHVGDQVRFDSLTSNPPTIHPTQGNVIIIERQVIPLFSSTLEHIVLVDWKRLCYTIELLHSLDCQPRGDRGRPEGIDASFNHPC